MAVAQPGVFVGTGRGPSYTRFGVGLDRSKADDRSLRKLVIQLAEDLAHLQMLRRTRWSGALSAKPVHLLPNYLRARAARRRTQPVQEDGI